jgi:threonine synthase
MKYTGTRTVERETFGNVLLSGFAPNGGLYVPTSIPDVQSEYHHWKDLTYSQLCFEIVRKFISEDEIPSDDLKRMITKAHSKFSHKDVVHIEPGDYPILELFHGPTLSFKDYALSLVAQMIEYFLEKRNKNTVIVVGTSGDTGSAAIHSVMDLKRVHIICLYPKGRCSKVQELQMTTISKPNVTIYRVEGTSDDLDEPIKEIFNDVEYSKKYSVSSINSINWARIMIQVVHFFYLHLKTGKSIVSIPTGASGNLASGYLAIKMGLPIKLIASVNNNDIIHHTLETGVFRMDKVFQTLSPSMDIQVPYNWERILYFAADGIVSDYMLEFEAKKKVTLPEKIISEIKKVISSQKVTDEETIETVKSWYKETGYVLDPHSAVGIAGAKKSNVFAVCIATASPLKFPEITRDILGVDMNDLGIHLEKLPTHFLEMKVGENWTKELKNAIEKTIL